MDPRKTFRLIMVLLAGFVLVFALSRKYSNSTQESLPQIDTDQIKVTPISAEDLSGLVKSRGGKVTVVNFWATFCEPCIEEFPYFMKARQKYQDQGLNLIFISLDFQSELNEVRAFLAEQRVDFETFIKGQRDGDFIKGVHPQWTGVIPITLIYGPDAQLVEFVPKALTFDELDEKISSVLNSKN